jgi:hypothetical protein
MLFATGLGAAQNEARAKFGDRWGESRATTASPVAGCAPRTDREASLTTADQDDVVSLRAALNLHLYLLMAGH